MEAKALKDLSQLSDDELFAGASGDPHLITEHGLSIKADVNRFQAGKPFVQGRVDKGYTLPSCTNRE